MWTAASTHRPYRTLAVLACALVALAFSTSGAGAQRSAGPSIPDKIWGVEIGPKTAQLLSTMTLLRLSQHGVNTLFIRRTGMSPRQFRRIQAIGRKLGFTIVSPLAEAGSRSAQGVSGPDAVTARCRQLKQSGSSLCAVRARSVASALNLAGAADVDLVLINVSGPGQLKHLPVSGAVTRFVAAPILRGGRSYRSRDWREAIRLVNGTSSLGLSVRPVGKRGRSALFAFTDTLGQGLLDAVRGDPKSTPPATPELRLKGTTSSSVTVTWAQSSKVTGYELAVDGGRIGTTAYTWASFVNLRCGTTYRVAIHAFGRGGLTSGSGSLVAATQGCTGGGTSGGGTGPTAVSSGTPSAPAAGSAGGGSSGAGGSSPGSGAPASPGSGSSPETHPSGPTTPSPSPPPVPPTPSPAPSPPPPSTPSPPTPPAGGDVWVSGFGLDANPCTQAFPCLTFGRAYRVASSGQTVYVGGGSYPAQIIADDPAKGSSARVTFQPVPGASVSVGQIDFGQAQLMLRGPSHVSVSGMSVGLVRAWAGADDLLWQNLDARYFGIFDATNVTIRGGDYGPCQAPREGGCESLIAGRAANILIDGAYIHDITTTDPVNFHTDGIFLRGSSNVTIRNSRFRGNHVDNIRVQDQACCLNQNLTIENNWFAPSLEGNGATRADAIDVDTPSPGLLIRNNSFAEGVGLQIRGSQPGIRVVGNLMANFACASGVTYSRNVFIPFAATIGQTPCGPTDKKVASFGYVNGPGFDYHITAGSPAIGAGDPGDCPGSDFDGQSRSGRCDAGSDQR